MVGVLRMAVGELAAPAHQSRELCRAQISPFCLPTLIVAEAVAAAPNGGDVRAGRQEG